MQTQTLPYSPPDISPLLRLRTVLKVTGLGRSTVYRMMAEHTFPAPVKLGKRAVAWRHDDVRQWTLSRAPIAELPQRTKPTR